MTTGERGIGQAMSGIVYSGDEDLQFQLLYLSHAVSLKHSRKCSIVNIDSVQNFPIVAAAENRRGMEGHMSRDFGPTARREVPRAIRGSIYRSTRRSNLNDYDYRRIEMMKLTGFLQCNMVEIQYSMVVFDIGPLHPSLLDLTEHFQWTTCGSTEYYSP